MKLASQISKCTYSVISYYFIGLNLHSPLQFYRVVAPTFFIHLLLKFRFCKFCKTFTGFNSFAKINMRDLINPQTNTMAKVKHVRTVPEDKFFFSFSYMLLLHLFLPLHIVPWLISRFPQFLEKLYVIDFLIPTIFVFSDKTL